MSGGVAALLWAAFGGLVSAAGLLLWASLRDERLAAHRERRFEELVAGHAWDLAPADSLRKRIHAASERYGVTAWLARDPEIPPLLGRAGLRGREMLTLFLLVQILLPVGVTAAVGVYWLVGSGERAVPLPAVAFASFALAYLAPKQVLRRIATARDRRLADELPSAVHLLRILFDCGLSTQQALKVIVSQGRTPVPTVAAEFEEVLRRAAAGASLADATREVAATSGVPALADLLALLRQIDRHGGSVEGPLSAYAALLEDRRRTDLQESVGRLSARMTVVMVLCLFPALLAFLAGPGFLAMIRALRGL